jgi:hypothetical protein
MWTQMECNNETDLNETVSEVEIGVVWLRTETSDGLLLTR